MQKLIANILNIKLPEFASEMTEEFSTASAAHAHLETAHIRDFHATISLRAHDAFIEIESFDDDADIACTAVTVNINDTIVACFATSHNLEDAFAVANRVALVIVLHETV